ncbi:MAG: FAD-dependent oxidoreductase [Chloroflexota bacterium]
MAAQFGSDYLRDARIVVIGAGAVGAAAAYRLAQAGATVTVVERLYPGAGTSGSSFAWLNGFSKGPRHYHRLNMASVRDHQELADELNGDWVHVGGGIHWTTDDKPDKAERIRQSARRLREWGTRVDATTPEIVMRELEPDVFIDPAAVSEVYVVPREGWLDGVAMAHCVLREAIRRYGVTHVHGTVAALRGPVGAVDTVVLEDGQALAADVVVNAGGPEAGRIAALAGATLPLDRQVGTLFVTAPAPVRLEHVLYEADAHVRPDGGARLLLQTEYMDAHAQEGTRLPLDAPVVGQVAADVQRFLPGIAGVPMEWVKVGVRPMPRDGYPIVGMDPEVSGLYTLVTHSGITLSARLSVLVTEELAGGEAADLEPYRPQRFLTQPALAQTPAHGH